ncbi:hypothetical protein [Dokdonella sp.]|uniref:hypothetical protein n=1 Tax=Dokdonella sp. TaxID=2291710 RepID=UPI0035272F6B
MTPITATNDFVIKFANAHRCSFSRWREKVPKGDEGGALDPDFAMLHRQSLQ